MLKTKNVFLFQPRLVYYQSLNSKICRVPFKKSFIKFFAEKFEIEILELVRNGLSIDNICEKVYVSKRTVSNHLANIFSKLGVSSRQEAIHVAEQLGYFSPE